MAPKPVDVVIRGKNESKGAFAEVTQSAEELEKKVKALNKPFESLKNVVSGVAGFMVVEFFRKSVEAAAEAEAAWARVGAAVSNAGIHFSGVKGELEALFTSMTKTTRFSDEQLSNAFATLMTVTHDYSKSVENLGLVANVAVAKQIDLSEAATIVGRVIEGTGTKALKQWGISTENASQALEQLRAQAQGFAERDAETLGGALHRLANRWDEVQEAIGRAITGGGHTGSGGGLDTFLERLTRLAEYIDSHRASFDRIERLFNAMGAVQGRGIEQFSPFARIMSRITGDDGSEPEVNFGAGMMAGGQRLMAENEIRANAARAKAERDVEAQKREVEELRKRIAETEGGLLENPDVARALEAYKRQHGGVLPGERPDEQVRNTLRDMQQRAALDRASMAYLNAGGPQAADLTTDPRTSNRPAQTMAEATKTVSGFGRGLRDSFGDGSQYLQDFDERLGKMAGESIPMLAEGFERMFEAIGKGANVFEAVGKGVAQMIGQVAAKMSAEEFAQGLAMLARSIWDFLGPNPVAGASATQHFAAAAAFGALAGGASVLGGGGGAAVAEAAAR
jgi:hypothetical protein